METVVQHVRAMCLVEPGETVAGLGEVYQVDTWCDHPYGASVTRLRASSGATMIGPAAVHVVVLTGSDLEGDLR